MVGTRKSKQYNATYSQVPAEDIWNLQKEAEAAARTGTDNDKEESEANETHVDSVLEPTATEEEEVQFLQYKDPPIPLDGNDNPSQMMPDEDDVFFEEPADDDFLEEQYQYFSQNSTEKRESFNSEDGVDALLKQEEYEASIAPMPTLADSTELTEDFTPSFTPVQPPSPPRNSPPRNTQPIVNPYKKKKNSQSNSTKTPTVVPGRKKRTNKHKTPSKNSTSRTITYNR